jgi:hypothetical protein
MDEPAASPNRLAEIAEQIRDGWVRGRGPLTGIKALRAVRQEALDLEATPDYIEILDQIIAAARSINGGSNGAYRRDAPQVLEQHVARLRALCNESAN